MSESYDSIGNQALKFFRHYIDPSRHIWLRNGSFETSVAMLDPPRQPIQTETMNMFNEPSGLCNDSNSESNYSDGAGSSNQCSSHHMSSAFEINQNECFKDCSIATDDVIK